MNFLSRRRSNNNEATTTASTTTTTEQKKNIMLTTPSPWHARSGSHNSILSSSTPPRKENWLQGGDNILWQIEVLNELLLLLTSGLPRLKKNQIHDRIYDLFMDCTGTELDHLLLSSDLYILIKLSKMRTMDAIRTRMEELSIRCKALLLQEFNLTRRYKNIFHFNFWALFVKEIFLSSKGADLTTLKNAIDSSGSWKNLFNLVYEDLPGAIIGSGDLRNEILQHFNREAGAVRRHARSKGRPRIKIISDLDDTVWCSSGKFPAGCDRKYPPHSFYPGIFALYKEVTIGSRLDGGDEASKSWRIAEAAGGPSPTTQPPSPLSPAQRSLNGLSAAASETKSAVSSRTDVLTRYSSTPNLGNELVQRVTCSASLEEHSAITVSAECEIGETIAEAWVKLANKGGRLVKRMTVNFGAQGDEGDIPGLEDHTLVMLSARPGVKAAKGFFESIMYRKFVKLKEQGYFHSIPTLLPGDLIAGMRAFILGASSKFASCISLDNRIVWKEVARKKYNDMVKYMELYPEYDFIFFGDDGQGDVQAAINALKNPKLSVLGAGPRLADVFIHSVMSPETLMSATEFQSPRQKLTRQITELGSNVAGMFRLFSRKHEQEYKDQIHYYKNSIQAAITMYDRDYISLEGLYHVSLQSCMDLLRLLRRGVYQHKTWRREYGQVLIDEYQRALDEVNTLLPNHMQLDDLPDLGSVNIEQEILMGSIRMDQSTGTGGGGGGDGGGD